MDIDRVLTEVSAELLTLLLLQRVTCNHFEGLLDIDGLLGTCLEVGDAALGLAEGHGPLGADDTLRLLDIDLVAQHHERKRVGVPGGCLNEELVAPRIEGVEGFGVVDVEDEHTAVGTTVEGHTEGLEALLAGGVPELCVGQDQYVSRSFALLMTRSMVFLW